MKNNIIVFIKENVAWIMALFFVLLLWQGGVKFFHVPEYILPTPSQIIAEMSVSYRSLMRHSWVTIGEIVMGFTLGMISAFILSIGIVYSRTIKRAVYPFLMFFQVVPKMALAPIFLVWFGYGILPKVLISALVCFFPIVINTVRGLTAIEKELLDLTYSLNATKTQVLRKIRIPLSLPYVFSGLKIAISLSVIGAVVGEFIGTDRGLGYLIMMANANLETAMMFSTIIVLSFIGITLFLVVCLGERIVLMVWPSGPRNFEKREDIGGV
ncbi:MAG: ABC transporter permease [Candidatus Omnitrophica bacterium]|nr:ABC transporter permease [Candidatus Omnitrophota bacterium]